MSRFLHPLAALCALAACQQASPPAAPADPVDSARTDADADAPARPAPVPASPEPAPAARPEPPRALGEALTRAQWQTSENRASCAPLGFTDDGGVTATPRRAAFSGGWGIAFDTPGQRSAYGVAGTGVKIEDAAEWQQRIRGQWPYLRPLDGRSGGLPAGSLAGYGLDGATPYAADRPGGEGQRSGAYVVIPGQACLYNLWSFAGRDHLERLLDGLTLLPTD